MKGQQLARLEGHPGAVRVGDLSADGKSLVGGGAGRTLKVWDVLTRREAAMLRTGAEAADGLPAFLGAVHSPDGKVVALATENKPVQVRDALTGELLHTLEGHDDTVTCLAFSPDGKFLASGSPDRSIKVWEPGSGKLLRHP